MKKILVPVDFSACSDSAVRYALGIAENTNTEIHLIHIVELDYSFTGGSALGAKLSEVHIEDKPMNQIKEVFEKADDLLVEMLRDSKVNQSVAHQTAILEGDLVGEIMEYSKKNEIGLIIMGSHGERGINTMLLGSNAQKMIRYSEVPVIVVQEDSLPQKFEKVVYTSDFKEESLNQSLKYVKGITEFYKSDLHLLYINTPNKFEESDVVDERLEHVIQEYDLGKATHSTFNSSWIEEGIVKFAKIHQPDLLIINTHGFKGLKKLFHNSIAESVANNVSVPVMVIQQH